MEYMQKKQQIISGVQYHNLLSFTLSQNKLEKNFRSIVEAVLLNDEKNNKLNEQLENLRQQNKKKYNQLDQQILQIVSNMQKNQRMYQYPINNQIHEKQQRDKLQHTLQKKQQKKQLEIKSEQFQQQLKKQNQLEQIIVQMKEQINNIKDQLATYNTRSKSLVKQSRQSIDQHFSKKEYGSSNANILQSFKENIQKQKQNSSKSFLNTFKAEIHQPIQNNIPQSNANQIRSQQNSSSNNHDEQFNNIFMEISNLKLSCENLKEIIADGRRKENKMSNMINQLNEQFKKAQNNRIHDNEDIYQKIKKLEINGMNTGEQIPEKNNLQTKEDNKTQRSPNTPKKVGQINLNQKKEFNDKISKLQTMIQNFISESEFTRFKKQIRDQLSRFQLKDSTIQSKIQQLQINIENQFKQNNKQLEKINTNISDINENMKENNVQIDRKNNIVLSKIEELKKNLQNLREDMEFYQSMNTQDNSHPPQQSKDIQSNTNEDNRQGKADLIDQKQLQQIKREFLGKMQEQRTYLGSQLRQLQKKLNNKNDLEKDMASLWDKLGQLSLFIRKKADQEDTRKNIVHLQKKIHQINSYLAKSQDQSEDATIARTNWFCLSCDKNLNTYQGRMGKHIAWDTIPLKGINRQFKNDKKCLPLLKR